MSKILTDSTIYPAIATAIRAKNGESTLYKPGEMAAAIAAIPTGGSPVLESLSVTENGTYTPGTGVDGFSSATVNVPNTYSASDEGKVISSGALVAQTSKSISVNGTYDTTTNNEVVVNVSGGGGLSFNTLINNQVFVSNRVGDKVCSYSIQYSDANRYLQRTSAEPVVIMNMTSSESSAYVGYGFIYFSDTLPTGTSGNQYGQITQRTLRAYQTPNGTPFNVASMSGAWDKSSSRFEFTINNNATETKRSYFRLLAGNVVTFLYGSNIAEENAFINATASQVAEIYALIDYIYTTYYLD